MKVIFGFIVFLIGGQLCLAQSANDLVKFWLAQNNIVSLNFQTCDPASIEAIVVTDGLCRWGGDLGVIPSAEQLQALVPAWRAKTTAATVAQQTSDQYAAAMFSGVSISCATAATICTSDISAAYATDPIAQADITANRLSIAADGVMSNGQTTIPWADKGGTLHMMTIPQFNEFATAVKQFVENWKIYALTIQSGGTATTPSSTVQLQ
jgi:hypothetical protein